MAPVTPQRCARCLQSLPTVDQSCGVALTAPALIVPRVLDFALCDLLVGLYDQVGGEDLGFLLDRDGKHRDGDRSSPEAAARSRHRACRSCATPSADQIAPPSPAGGRSAISSSPPRAWTAISSPVTTARSGGHFFRHRDNVNAGAEHRRFAVSINLNGDYEGCDLVFPEFGRRTYRAPVGGAIVFSCGALHEVTPIRRGRRYAFLPFLYGEEDAALRGAQQQAARSRRGAVSGRRPRPSDPGREGG